MLKRSRLVISAVRSGRRAARRCAEHSGCRLSIVARGDGMDHHHLIEDVGIALGKAIYDALGDKRGIERYGSMIVPLGDALVACSIDLSGRAYLNFQISSSICFSLASGPGSVPPYCAFRKRSVSA